MIMTECFFSWRILPHLCDKVIKKEIVEHNIAAVADTVSFGEDAACTFPCMMEIESVAILESAPYHYRQREGSIVKDIKELGRGNFIGLYRAIVKAFGEDPLLKQQLKLYMFFTLLWKAYSELSNFVTLVNPSSSISN